MLIAGRRPLGTRSRTEGKGMACERLTNYAETRRTDRITALAALRDNPNQSGDARFYHLDVGAMYPNIILTNRLQPPAMVTTDTCAACDYNRPREDGRSRWMWRAARSSRPRSASRTSAIKAQLEYGEQSQRARTGSGGRPRYWADLEPRGAGGTEVPRAAQGCTARRCTRRRTNP